MRLLRKAISTKAGFRVQMRGHSHWISFDISFQDLGNLSEVPFGVFSGTSAEKRVILQVRCLGMSW